MKQYLGDAVYASDELNPGHITLTTGSHLPENADNIIHLEPSVLRALEDFSAAREKHDREVRAAAIITRIPEDLQDSAEIIYADQIDVNHLEHADALRVMRALNAGRWERKESGVEGKLDYIAVIDGWKVRLWAAGPPDSCRVIEEEYEIPAVPARTGTRKRVICAKPAQGQTNEPPAIDPNVFDAA